MEAIRQNAAAKIYLLPPSQVRAEDTVEAPGGGSRFFSHLFDYL
jgi:hypothetical protein